MESDEMLWASPSRIVDGLKRLGTPQKDTKFTASLKMIEKLEQRIKEPVLEETL